jgi:hypothetical protein
MNVQQDIQDIFSILHDGTIESWTGNKQKLVLKVRCPYLAKRIDKSFEYFYIEIRDIEKIELFAWMNPRDSEQKIFTELSDIFKAELEILAADKEENNVVVVCNQHDTNYEYCGGNLTLICNEIKVFDQNNCYITIEKFDEICNQYWNNLDRD